MTCSSPKRLPQRLQSEEMPLFPPRGQQLGSGSEGEMWVPTPQKFHASPQTQPAFPITSPAETLLYSPDVKTTGT